MDTLIASLIDRLKQRIPFLETRSAPASGEYLEVVIARQDLQTCYELLSQALGPPVKEFGKAARLERTMQKAVDQLGGIWLDQCLFLKSSEKTQVTYAALWPWASNATRITLKMGVHQV